MATINLLPGGKRPKSIGMAPAGGPGKKTGDKSKPALLRLTSLDRSVALPLVIVILILAAAWGVLWFKVANKERALSDLSAKITGISSGPKAVSALKTRKAELAGKLIFYKDFLKSSTNWSRKCSELHKALPGQVWLTEIYVESKPVKKLVIKGKATSILEKDILESISKFVTSLKSQESFREDYFKEIKLGALESSKRGNSTVVQFNLYCIYKID